MDIKVWLIMDILLGFIPLMTILSSEIKKNNVCNGIFLKVNKWGSRRYVYLLEPSLKNTRLDWAKRSIMDLVQLLVKYCCWRMLTGSGIVGMFLDLATPFLRGILPEVGTKWRITKRQNYKMATITKRQNHKTATTTKRRLLQNGEKKSSKYFTKIIQRLNYYIVNP